MADALFLVLFEKMFPVMRDAIKEQIIKKREISIVIGMKIAKFLEEEGLIKSFRMIK